MLRSRGVEEANATLAAAREAGILVSAQELRELEDFFGSWIWGPIAAAFMFGSQDKSFEGADDRPREARDPSADPSLLAEAKGPAVALPGTAEGELAAIVARRRSRRVFGRQPLLAAQLAACLRAAFGITDEWELEDGLTLPLTGAPSPGGLNTYDAFVLSQTVNGFEQGTYRYLPRGHALARVPGNLVPFDRLFGDQSWCTGAACAIVFVADFRRQESRYLFPTTLSATLIEAGARVELLLLAAEESSLPAVLVGMSGVGAYDRQLASEAGLPGATSMTIPICAVLVGAATGASR